MVGKGNGLCLPKIDSASQSLRSSDLSDDYYEKNKSIRGSFRNSGHLDIDNTKIEPQSSRELGKDNSDSKCMSPDSGSINFISNDHLSPD